MHIQARWSAPEDAASVRVLAAGEGRRMGGVAKPLRTLQGVSLISRHLVALSGAGVDEVVVVTGHARHAVEQQVQSFPVILMHNAAHTQGQQGSVRAGLAALSGSFDAAFIVLADQPLIGASDLTELIAAFKKRPAGHVVVPVVPVVHGQRGNPIVLDQKTQAQILASDTNLGCRHWIEQEPDLVHVHETANTRFITDLDTVEDVRALAQRPAGGSNCRHSRMLSKSVGPRMQHARWRLIAGPPTMSSRIKCATG